MTSPFQAKLQLKLMRTFKKLNAAGKNLGGRLPLQLELWAKTQAGSNPAKAAGGSLALVDDSELALVPIKTKVGDAKRYIDGAVIRVGDADLEIAALAADESPLTREQLLGIGLEAGQEIRYRLAGELYTIAAGTLDESDGLRFKMALVRVP